MRVADDHDRLGAVRCAEPAQLARRLAVARRAAGGKPVEVPAQVARRRSDRRGQRRSALRLPDRRHDGGQRPRLRRRGHVHELSRLYGGSSGFEASGRPVERAEDEQHDDDRRRCRGRPEQAADAQREPHPPDRVLDEPVAHDREQEGEGDERQLGSEREVVPGRLRRQDQHRPVPEVERVGAIAEVAERRERENASGAEHRRRSRQSCAAEPGKGVRSE